MPKLGPTALRLPLRQTASLLFVGGLSLGALGCAIGSDAAPQSTLTPTVTATATATASATPNPDPLVLWNVSQPLEGLRQRLEQEITTFQQRVGGNFAVAVTDLQTGETVHVNGDSLRIPGCTMNFFVLLQTVRDLQANQYPETAAGSLIARTVYYSNPGTAAYLLRQSGGGDTLAGMWKVNDLLRNVLKLKTGVYDHPPANDTFTLNPGKWQENTISPLDFNRALTQLYRGEVVNGAWTAYLIDKMSSVSPGLNHLIAAGVGDPNAIVAHKNGYIDYIPYYVDNDIGMVLFNRGGKQYAYAITFWSQDNPWVLSDAPLGAALSRLAWEYFSTTYTG
jgi:hypothetical protein